MEQQERIAQVQLKIHRQALKQQFTIVVASVFCASLLIGMAFEFGPKAFADYNRAMVCDVTYAWAYLYRGRFYKKSGQQLRAKADFETCLRYARAQGDDYLADDAAKYLEEVSAL